MAWKCLIGLAERAPGFGEVSSCAVREETCIICRPKMLALGRWRGPSLPFTYSLHRQGCLVPTVQAAGSPRRSAPPLPQPTLPCLAPASLRSILKAGSRAPSSRAERWGGGLSVSDSTVRGGRRGASAGGCGFGQYAQRQQLPPKGVAAAAAVGSPQQQHVQA
jgi:hypothetical protein